MSIGLVIANISGSLHASPAVAANAGVSEGTAISASATPAASQSAAEPLSGQAQLSPGFSVVVLELLNDQGTVTNTIPSAQQLAAYRNGTASPPS